MFKKSVSVQTTRPLSGKDVKALRRSVQLQFPDADEDEVAQLLPAKAEIALLKLSNRAACYTVNGGSPLFFDPDGRGDILAPTVYALWLCPQLLPPVFTYSEVSPKVLGGADLFLQGFIVDGPAALGDFAAGDLRCVRIPQNAFPFAVGTLELGSADVARTGLKGKGLKLLHCYTDQLWALGDKSAPDAGFTPQRIFPQTCGPACRLAARLAQAAAGEPGAGASASAPAQAPDPPDGGPAAGAAAGGAPAGGAAGAPPEEHRAGPPDAGAAGSREAGAEAGADAAANGHAGEAPGDAGGGAAEAAGAPAAGGPAAGAPPPPPESQDELLHYCLLAGLRRVPPGDLPCLTSDFYSKYMLPAKPAGANVDVKKSSYKKLSKLLSTFEKKGVLSQKVIHKQDNLSAVHASHALLASFEERAPTETAGGGEADSAEGRDARGAGPSGAPGASDPAGGRGSRISVTIAYRVPVSLRPVFGAAADADRDALHSADDARAALAVYAARQGLGAGAGRLRLDGLLAGALFNKLEPEKEGSECAAADVGRRLLDRLTAFHRVSRRTEQGPVEVLQRGAVKPIQVSMQDRQGGRKHITRIIHAESFAIDPDELGGVLQRKFQTSASVTRLPGKADTGKEIALQGNLLHEVGKVLQAEYGVPPEYVDVKAKK